MPTTISGNTGVSQVQGGSITAADLDGAQTGDAPIFGCRAWVNFDGTKDTTGAASTANTNRLIRASGNVTSVLRNGTGDYTVTFTEAMSDDGYAWAGNCGTLNGLVTGDSTSKTTTQLFIATAGATNNTKFDESSVHVTIFR